MPLHLLDLPPEILDGCLGELLPPLAVDEHPSGLSNAIFSHPDPRDLCMVLSVCRALNRLALPWIWRRVALCISDELSENRFLVRKRFSQWKLLCSHPEFATHTRVLGLHLADFDSSRCTGILDPQMLLPALSLMSNLRVVHFDFGGIKECAVFDAVYTKFFSSPFLHTMVSTYFPLLPKVSTCDSLARLYGFRLDSSDLLHAIKAAPHLESLAIAQTAGDIDVSEHIPWATLRQLELCNIKVCARILDGFTSWSERFPNTSSPLEEISIFFDPEYDEGITTAQIRKLCIIFDRQNITSLSLRAIPQLDDALFSQITESFPRVQNLSLSSYNWSVDLEKVADSLGKLTTLKSLEWNYTHPDCDSEPLFTLVHRKLRARRRSFVFELALTCQALEYVLFYGCEILPMSFSLTRDDSGRHKSHETAYPLGVHIFSSTSCWDARRYNRI